MVCSIGVGQLVKYYYQISVLHRCSGLNGAFIMRLSSLDVVGVTGRVGKKLHCGFLNYQCDVLV